jgi:uncharacterized peroxidase-related enzyme
VEAHALDLRSEIDKSPTKANVDARVAAIKTDWRNAELSHADRSLCVFAEKLTRTPGEMERADVERLRAAGFDDRAIHDATQAIAYFNYINRVADGLGTDAEDFYPPRPPKGA